MPGKDNAGQEATYLIDDSGAGPSDLMRPDIRQIRIVVEF